MEWNDKKNYTLTFQYKPTEEMKNFILRLEKEHKERREAFEERVEQLCNEFIEVDDRIREKITQVFAIGYQCGWNDHYDVTEITRGSR